MPLIFQRQSPSLTSGAGGDPLSLPLVTSSTPLFTYLGSFTGSSDFDYGAGAMSVNGSMLYMSGLEQSGASLGSMTIPAIGGTASTIVAPQTFTPSGVDRACGSLVYNGKLYITIALSYDVGPLNVFLVKANTNVTSISSACAADGSAGSASRLFSNYMGLVPSIWQSLLGGPAFVAGGPGGMVGLSIISNMCCGFGFSTFDPDTVVGGSPVALTEFLNYPYSDPVSAGTALWSRTTVNSKGGDDYVSVYDGPLGCAFIPEGSRSLLFVSVHCYGPSAARFTSPCDPAGNASGSNETPTGGDAAYRRVQITAYDLATLVSNKQGGGHVYAPLPYAFWELPSWQSILMPGATGASATCVQTGQLANSWMTYDSVNRRLYASQEGNFIPEKVHLWSVAPL